MSKDNYDRETLSTLLRIEKSLKHITDILRDMNTRVSRMEEKSKEYEKTKID